MNSQLKLDKGICKIMLFKDNKDLVFCGLTNGHIKIVSLEKKEVIGDIQGAHEIQSLSLILAENEQTMIYALVQTSISFMFADVDETQLKEIQI